jgi:hypothetical protein
VCVQASFCSVLEDYVSLYPSGSCVLSLFCRSLWFSVLLCPAFLYFSYVLLSIFFFRIIEHVLLIYTPVLLLSLPSFLSLSSLTFM